MSNARRIIERSKPKKAPVVRARRLKVDFESLPDAFVEGKMVATLRSTVYFMRTLNGKTALHEGMITSFNDSNGDVSIWDETRGQYYLFRLCDNSPVVKATVLNDVLHLDQEKSGSSQSG